MIIEGNDRFEGLLPQDWSPISGKAPSYRRLYHYTDFPSFVASIPDTVPVGAWHETAWNTDSRFVEFTGCASMLAAKQLADGRTIDPYWAQQELTVPKSIQATVVRPQWVHDVVGGRPNVPRAISGHPVNMRRRLRPPEKKTVATLVVPIAAVWHMSQDKLLAAALAAAWICDCLESQGQFCDVIVCARFVRSRIGAEVACRVKAAGQPIDLHQIGFGLGHPGMFRRMMFSAVQQDPKCQPLGQSLGIVARFQHTAGDPCFLLPSAQICNTADPKVAFEIMRKALIAQGCTVFGETALDQAA